MRNWRRWGRDSRAWTASWTRMGTVSRSLGSRAFLSSSSSGRKWSRPSFRFAKVVLLMFGRVQIKHVYRHHFRRYEPPCKGIQYTVPFGHAAHMRQRAKFNKQPVKDL